MNVMREMLARYKQALIRVFMICLLLGGGCGCFILGKNRIQKYNREGAVLTQQIFEMEQLLAERESWEARSNWVKHRIPEFSGRDHAFNHLLAHLKKSLEEHQLTLKSHKFHRPTANQLVEMEKTDFFNKTTISVRILGKEKNIVKFIHELQHPERFTGIDHLEIVLGDRGLVCELEISQFFVIGGGVANLAGNNG